MFKIIIKLNIARLSLFLSAVFFICYSPIAYAKEINSQNVAELINISRIQNNLNPLSLNVTLSKVAQAKATDMIKNHYFSHTSPAGITPWYWFDKNNYFYQYAGENLAINYDDAEEEQAAWMESSAHKKNILSANFKEIGIATATGIIDGKKSHITVTVFGTPAKNIFATTTTHVSLSNKNSYILGVQSDNRPVATLASTKPNHLTKGTNTKIANLIKKQSPNIVWTIALVAILIVLKDMVLKTIQTKTFHHKHSMVNLILFIMLYAVLF